MDKPGRVNPANAFALERLIRPHLREVQHYEGVDPPSVLAQRLGLSEEAIIKLDGNENPYGCSPRVYEALARAGSYHIYPDPAQGRVRDALASYADTEPAQVVAGAGCDELIDLVLRLTLEPGDRVLELTPTFGMYSFCTRIQGGVPVAVPRDAEFQVDLPAVKKAIDRRTKVVFVTNPNNPTGTLTPEADVLELLETGILVVVDETYHEFSGFTVAHLVPEHENLVVLRTLSKWAGLAGMRIGYGIMSPRLVQQLLAIKMPYNISVAAEVALLATMEDTDLLLHRVRLIVEERERLFGLLQRFPGITSYPSKGNFILYRFPPGRAGAIYQGLMKAGIFVRYFDRARLADCLRISVGRPEHTDALVRHLGALLRS